MVLTTEEVQALCDSIEIIVDLAQRTLDACTDFSETLGVGCGDAAAVRSAIRRLDQ